MNKRFSLEAVIDYVGYADCYSGHGHAFVDPKVVACIRFSVPVTYKETVRDIIDLIIEDIDNQIDPIEWLDENLTIEEKDQIADLLTDDNIREAIRALIPKDVKDSDPFFEETYELDNDLVEYPLLIGYIHVWREE